MINWLFGVAAGLTGAYAWFVYHPFQCFTGFRF